MKRKKFLALALAGVLMLTLLTGCSGSGKGEDRLVAEAFVRLLQEDPHSSQTFANINPIYDIPHMEEFVQKIDEFCTKKSEASRESWEDTVWNLSGKELAELAKVLDKDTYGTNPCTSLRFWKDPSGTPEQQAQQADSKARVFSSFWGIPGLNQPYQGDAWFDSVVLTRPDGTKYRFLLSICHN